jgi:choline dehydrogenase-like flavoprotein
VRAVTSHIFVLKLREFSDYMVYNRGSRDDWNALANLTGDPGWSWKAMKPYMFANEKVRASPLFTARQSHSTSSSSFLRKPVVNICPRRIQPRAWSRCLSRRSQRPWTLVW